MWDVLNKRPRGRLSLRTLHVLATGLIVAVLLCSSVLAKVASADTKDALLKDGALQYDSKTFAQQPDLGANDPRNFSTGTHVFGYSASGSTKVEYIFIDGGVTPDKAIVGAYVTYTYTSPSTYADQSTPVQVNITHMTSDPTVATSNSCNGFGGLGWIFCPVASSLSGAIDGIYSFITQFFDTPPLTSDSAVFKIWDTVRSIANIAFVIAFLIIIYSQITSLGISKYGIRTMLPRLIVAAVLVNISYWVCSLGIDLSNFLGHSVESFFMSYLATLQGTTVIPDWSTLTQALIGGGAAGGVVIGGIAFSIATGGGLPALVFILLGMAVTVALALLTALIILAARQAILVIFTIISPLAFVAMVLPSTEKLFGKWKDTMLSMLILFPLFGLVYGGAQVAGAAIVLGSKGNIFLLLLGKFVIFIPLAITPLLIKFSSGILGTVASAVDGRRKALNDRFGKWNKEQIDYHRRMSLPKNGPIARFNPARRTARIFENEKSRQAKNLEGADARSARLAQSTRRYRKADLRTRASLQGKQLSDATLDNNWYEHMASDTPRGTRALKKFADLQNMTNESTANKAHVDDLYNDLRKGNATPEMTRRFGLKTSTDLARTAYSAAEKINATAIHKNMTDQEVLKKMNSELLGNGTYVDANGITRQRLIYGKQLQDYATGIGNRKRMLAIEVEKETRIETQEANAATELMNHFNLDAANKDALATDPTARITRTDNSGNTMTFDFGDEDVRTSAIEWIAKNGAYSQKKRLAFTAADPATNAKLAGFIERSLAANGFGAMAPWANDKSISEMGQGRIAGMDDVLFHDFREIHEGRLSSEKLMSANNTALNELFGVQGDREAKNANWNNYISGQEAMIRREMDGRPQADIDAAVINFRNIADEKFDMKYYDLVGKAEQILADPQLSSKLNPQQIAEMENAIGAYNTSASGQTHIAYREQVEAAQQRARDNVLQPGDRALLDRFMQVSRS